MKELFKKIGSEIWERVIVSNKSTITGWLLAGAIIGLNEVALWAVNWQSPYAKYVALVVGLIGSALKKKQAAVIAATALLLFSGPAFAQEATGPLAFQVTSDLSLHLNVSVAAISYDLTNKQFLGKVPITGLYVLTSKRLLDAGFGLGGKVSFGGSQTDGNGLEGEVDAAIVSPRVALTPLTGLHAALLGGYRFGLNHAWVIGLAPTLEF